MKTRYIALTGFLTCMSLFPAAGPSDTYIKIVNPTDNILTFENIRSKPVTLRANGGKIDWSKRGNLNELVFTSDTYFSPGPHTLKLPDASRGSVEVWINSEGWRGGYSLEIKKFISPETLRKEYSITGASAGAMDRDLMVSMGNTINTDLRTEGTLSKAITDEKLPKEYIAGALVLYYYDIAQKQDPNFKEGTFVIPDDSGTIGSFLMGIRGQDRRDGYGELRVTLSEVDKQSIIFKEETRDGNKVVTITPLTNFGDQYQADPASEIVLSKDMFSEEYML